MLHLRFLFFLVFCFSFSGSYAQFTDDFSDGTFTSPTADWAGDTAWWDVNPSFQLWLNDSSWSGGRYIYTNSSVIDSTEWVFWSKFNYSNPTPTSNFYRVYLVSDQSNLNGTLNGYYLKIGGPGTTLTGDTLEFYRQDGNIHTLIAQSPGACFISTGTRAMRIRVRRGNSSDWLIEGDCAGGNNLVSLMQFTEATYSSTSHFGFVCQHTASTRDQFFFDDLYVGAWQLDTTPPVVLGISPVPDSMVRVTFNEPLDPVTAQNVSKYSLSPFGTPASATLTANPRVVELIFHPNNFQNNTTYTLTTTGVKDLEGNAMTIPAMNSFTYLIPATATYKQVIINEVLTNPDLAATSMPSEFVELYNPTNQFFSLKDWQFADRSAPKVLDSIVIGPNEYLILCKESDTALFQPFGNVLPLPSWPAINNDDENLYLFNQNGVLIDSLFYNQIANVNWHDIPTQEGGGWTLELVDPSDDCSYSGNWKTSRSATGGTPGAQNSVYFPGADTLPPVLVSVNVTGTNKIQVCFDETMDVASLQNGTYSSTPALPVLSAVPIGPDYQCVDITFTDTIQIGQFYTLTVSGVADCKGRYGGGTGQFVLGGNAQPFEVVITEVFTDYTMPTGTPPTPIAAEEDDYIEIYNLSPRAISLNGWTLDDDPAGTAGQLENYTLLPFNYLILCKDKTIWSGYGNAVQVSSWQDLGSTGDSLELRDANGVLIDFVYYSDEWYHDDTKNDGGWSIEKTDPAWICMNEENWRASYDARGGTPGSQNSQNGSFSDITPPKVLRATPLDTLTVRVLFDEILDAVTASDPGNYEINPGAISPILAILPAGTPPYIASYVDLLLPVGLDTNQVYCLKVKQVTDCPGTEVDSTQTLCFGIPQVADSGDIVLNEILFNAYTGGSRFVELYNKSAKILDISTLSMATENFPIGTKVTDETILLLPGAYICLTEDSADVIARYLPQDRSTIYEINDLPTFSDSKGECVIYTDTSHVLDRFAYNSDMHFSNLDSKDGVSLERLSFDAPTQDRNNWHSAATEVHYATPGYQNSQILIPDPQEGKVWLDPLVFSPDQDALDDYLIIKYEFQTLDNNVRVAAYDSRGRLVKMIAENTLISNSNSITTDTSITGFFQWDGTTDAGHKAPVGIYAILFEVNNVNPQNETLKVETFKLAAVLAAKFQNP